MLIIIKLSTLEHEFLFSNTRTLIDSIAVTQTYAIWVGLA
jgi:hypothetical protein